MKNYYRLLHILVFFPCWASSQPYFYVAPNGSDFNEGNLANPFRNIQKACDVSRPGSTVYIFEGVYYENLIMNVSGSIDSIITFKPYQDGQVIVDGDYKNATLLEIANQDFLKIQSIHFRNANGDGSIGILLQGAASNITIQYCEITNVGFTNDANELVNDSSNAYPFIAYGNNPNSPIKNLTFSNNKINNCRPGRSNCFELSGNVNNFLVAANNISQNENTGIALIGHNGVCSDPDFDLVRNGTLSENKCFLNSSPVEPAAGIYIDGCKNIIVEKNTTYKNQYGIKIGCENPSYFTSLNTVRDNIVYLNYLSGLNIGNFENDENSGMVKNCSFTNNTIFRNDQNQSGNGEVILKRVENLSFFNNIIFSTGQNIMMSINLNEIGNNSMDYNDWYNNTNQQNTTFNYNNIPYPTFQAYKSESSFEQNSKFLNPDFESTLGSAPNFHLLPTSPLIDAGKQELLYNSTTDFDGNERVVGAAIDMGCFEFNSIVGVNEIEMNKEPFSIWPNPSSSKIYIESVDKDLIKEITIYGSSGNFIKTIVNQNRNKIITILIDDFPNGIYFFKTISNKGFYNTKIIKI